jgi:hypothetical protein
VLPDVGRPNKESTFNTTKNSKEVQIHPTDPKKLTLYLLPTEMQPKSQGALP